MIKESFMKAEIPQQNVSDLQNFQTLYQNSMKQGHLALATHWWSLYNKCSSSQASNTNQSTQPLSLPQDLKVKLAKTFESEKNDHIKSYWLGKISHQSDTTKWASINLGNEEKEMIYLSIMAPIKRPDLIQKCANLLLYGPPGTGKSYFARAIAEFLNRPFITVDPQDLLQFKDVNPLVVWNKLMEVVMIRVPCIVFLDEFDQYVNLGIQGFLKSLLTSLDGQDKDAPLKNMISFIGATNCIQVIYQNEEALMRRFNPIHISLPSFEKKLTLFKQKLKQYEGKRRKFDLQEEEIKNILEKYSEGFSIADVCEAIDISISLPVRSILNKGQQFLETEKFECTQRHWEEGFQRVNKKKEVNENIKQSYQSQQSHQNQLLTEMKQMNDNFELLRQDLSSQSLKSGQLMGHWIEVNNSNAQKICEHLENIACQYPRQTVDLKQGLTSLVNEVHDIIPLVQRKKRKYTKRSESLKDGMKIINEEQSLDQFKSPISSPIIQDVIEKEGEDKNDQGEDKNDQ